MRIIEEYKSSIKNALQGLEALRVRQIGRGDILGSAETVQRIIELKRKAEMLNELESMPSLKGEVPVHPHEFTEQIEAIKGFLAYLVMEKN